jgi:hypothetical protein
MITLFSTVDTFLNFSLYLITCRYMLLAVKGRLGNKYGWLKHLAFILRNLSPLDVMHQCFNFY